MYAWMQARRIWSADHGDVLGDQLERLQFEFATKRALTRRVIKEHAHG